VADPEGDRASQPGDGPARAARIDGPVPWPNLPPPGWPRTRELLRRAVRRRCPYCGGGRIFANYFTLKDLCPTCEVRFEREDGYFLGGYALNLVVSEFIALGLAVWLLFFTGLRDLPLLGQEAIAIGLALGFPLALFPFSRTFWMALDLTLHPPEASPLGAFRARDMDKGRRRG
jgi:uncharacterized protein (DUF983 family)